MTEAAILEENANETLQNDEVLVTDDISSENKNNSNEEDFSESPTEEIDYGALIEEDISTLRGEFAELADLSDITELDNPMRYAELRDLGLSATEAYLATRKRRSDNRSHLRSVHSIKATHQGSMSDSEMASARELFGDISDAEIRKLYKRVTK